MVIFHAISAALNRGQRLFEGGAYSVEGGAYSRAALIRGGRLFEGGPYSRAALIRGRRFFNHFTRQIDFFRLFLFNGTLSIS